MNVACTFDDDIGIISFTLHEVQSRSRRTTAEYPMGRYREVHGVITYETRDSEPITIAARRGVRSFQFTHHSNKLNATFEFKVYQREYCVLSSSDLKDLGYTDVKRAFRRVGLGALMLTGLVIQVPLFLLYLFFCFSNDWPFPGIYLLLAGLIAVGCLNLLLWLSLPNFGSRMVNKDRNGERKRPVVFYISSDCWNPTSSIQTKRVWLITRVRLAKKYPNVYFPEDLKYSYWDGRSGSSIFSEDLHIWNIIRALTSQSGDDVLLGHFFPIEHYYSGWSLNEFGVAKNSLKAFSRG